MSTALDLSPIPEDREKAAEAPRGDWEIVEGVVFLGGREICHEGLVGVKNLGNLRMFSVYFFFEILNPEGEKSR